MIYHGFVYTTRFILTQQLKVIIFYRHKNIIIVFVNMRTTLFQNYFEMSVYCAQT